ncbi:MAG: glutamine--tRNA ligase/YqeY domain fusion protein [Planctomycetota bacterium]|nr:glutamine--tRNA ligase/YqeY domain fusion protein [Planctomycetota bacterium]
MNAPESDRSLNFVEQIVQGDQETNKWEGRVHTRFPPEPNGYLHIGHAKSICLNFGVAEKFGGSCNLRFDDTNPAKEEVEYVESIKEDIRWLGFDWQDREYFASDYFEQLYQWACQLITENLAYVCELTPDEMRSHRGTLTEPGIASPYRDRPAAENQDLFARMRTGEFPTGSRTLRAKIDMANPNLNLRDPVMYRILHTEHHRTGNQWCIYPTYDFTHGQSDSIEKITHSICTLEFENHRPLYDWYCQSLQIYHPQQIEFARLNLTYTVLSKRRLLELVAQDHVSGWDDPRMPTLSGLRRRGFTANSIRQFCDTIGIAKATSTIDVGVLENCVREDLNKTASRVMAVQRPVKLVLIDYPEDQVEMLQAVNNPENPEAGSREVPLSRELYIERDDFHENPPGKFFRLKPGGEVRLRYAYIIRCEEVIKDGEGNIIELHCTHDADSRSGMPGAGRRVKGTLHWVSANHCLQAEVRLYDRLFLKEDPSDVADDENYLDHLNPDSLQTLTDCRIEPSLARAQPGDRFQFERLGYYCVDRESQPEHLVLNRTVSLRDSWAKLQKSQQQGKKGKKKPNPG